MRKYTITKPSFAHDAMEVRRDGQVVGRFEGSYSTRGEALGRAWVQTVESIDGYDVPADEPRDTAEFGQRMSKADRVGYALTWGEGGEKFGEFTDEKWDKKWALRLGEKILYWWGCPVWYGGCRFGYDDSDDQTYLTAQRYPLRTETWQKVTMVDELPEPEGIVAAQMGHTFSHVDQMSRQSRGNTGFLIYSFSR